MTLAEFKNEIHLRLDEQYGKDETESFFQLLVEHYLGFKRVDAVLNPNYEIESTKSAELKNAVQQLKNNIPLQYITACTEFYGLAFKVNENVLIPRPETEELVDWIIKDHKQVNREIHILDVGTGSGCIAISLAKYLPQSLMKAVDISKSALFVANKNSRLNKVSVEFIEHDILDEDYFPPLVDKIYDIIVSNPPYVRTSEKLKMGSNVLDHEPNNALFVSDGDPLIFYKKIAKFASKFLQKNGCLYFEINEYLSEEMISLLRELKFSEIELRKDIFGKNRMIKAKKE